MNKLLLILGLILVGCANIQNTDDVLIENTSYKIESITLDDESMLKAPQNASIIFENDKIYGNAGCNNYFASLEWIDNETIGISKGGSTKMMCVDESANTFEYDYLLNLNGEFSVSKDGNIIELDGDKINIIIRKMNN